jgi:hypothetical protein
LAVSVRACFGKVDGQPRGKESGQRDVGHAAFAEERALALVSAVDELVDQDEGAWRQVLFERAARRQRDQIGDAGALEDVDIGPVIDVGGRMPMPFVVARQKHDRQPVDLAGQQRSRRLAPRAGDDFRLGLLQARQIVNARAADHPKNRFRHGPPHCLVGISAMPVA